MTGAIVQLAVGSSMRVRLGAVGVAVVLGLACARDSRDVAPSSYHLRVDQVLRAGARGGDDDGGWVRDAVGASAGATRWLSAAGGSELPVTVRYATLAAADGEPVLRVELEVAVPDALRAEVEGRLSATVELAGEGPIALSRDLPIALERAVAVLDAQLTLARGNDADRARLLGDPDPEIVLLGLDWVEAHRARDLADAVAELAEHRSERVALRAVECLGVVGSPRHAERLVRHPRLGDAAHANRLYETLARLGGEAAAGFLEFAARNEEDPDLARSAQMALSRVRLQPEREAPRNALPRPARGHRHAVEGTG